MKRVYVLLGGMVGPDGSLVSRGMTALADRISQLPDVICSKHYWSSYWSVVTSINQLPHDVTVALVGYSGGGSRATWITDYVYPRAIALVVGYDPSPISSMGKFGRNVDCSICYRNATANLFGLGGGIFSGAAKTGTITINIPHLAVQFNEALHARTLEAIENL